MEQPGQSQQNLVSDHHGHTVLPHLQSHGGERGGGVRPLHAAVNVASGDVDAREGIEPFGLVSDCDWAAGSAEKQ